MTNIKGVENSAEALLETYCSQMGVRELLFSVLLSRTMGTPTAPLASQGWQGAEPRSRFERDRQRRFLLVPNRMPLTDCPYFSW